MTVVRSTNRAAAERLYGAFRGARPASDPHVLQPDSRGEVSVGMPSARGGVSEARR